MHTTVRFRLAAAGEMTRLAEVQRDAGAVFRDVGMAAIADNPVPSVDTFAGYQRDGRAFVAVDLSDTPVGFALVDQVDGAAHLEQVSVAPAYAGRGIGRRLIDRVGVWAAEHGMPAVTLVTFRDVAWNAPYYARLGFEPVPAADRGPGLAAIVADEAAFGLDPAARVVMRRAV